MTRDPSRSPAPTRRHRATDLRSTLRLVDSDDRDELAPLTWDAGDGEMPRALLSLVSARVLRDDDDSPL